MRKSEFLAPILFTLAVLISFAQVVRIVVDEIGPVPAPSTGAPNATPSSAPIPTPTGAHPSDATTPPSPDDATSNTRPAPESILPAEAWPVLAAIARGGPYAYPKDDSTFQNREARLPQRPRGHYREYTVETPGERDRGARRIVVGGDPPSEYFYTDDHYDSFRRFDPRTGAPR